MAKRLWNWYNKHLDANPFRTKAVMCLVLSGTADVCAQSIAHYRYRGLNGHGHHAPPVPPAKTAAVAAVAAAGDPAVVRSNPKWLNLPEIDLRRQASIWTYALCYQAPFGHWWYGFLDRQSMRLPRMWVVPFKVVLDQTVDATVATTLYMSFVPWAEGRADPSWIYHKLRLDFVPTYLVDCSFWPIMMGLNFKFVPLKHQLLFANVCVFAWSTFISLVCHDDSFLRQLDDYNPFATEKTIAEDMSFLRNYNTHRGDDSTSTSDGPREEIKPSPDP